VCARRGRIAADLWYAGQALSLGLPWAAAAIRARLAESLSGLALDLRGTFRGLSRQPTLVIVGVLSLALGSGLVTAAATMVNGAWFAPIPWENSERMIDLSDTHPTEVPPTLAPGTSVRSFERWRADLPAGLFDRLEAGARARVTIQVGTGVPSSVRAVRVSEGYADLLEFEPRLGRLITASDTRVDANPVVVLSHRVWSVSLGESPDVIGRTVAIDGVEHTIVGVLRADVRMLDEAEVLLPLLPAANDATYTQRGVQVLGVLADGVSVKTADAVLASLASAMYAEATELSPGWSAAATPLRTVLARRGVDAAVALAMVFLCIIVLMVAALNLASLLLARTTGRARELGVRAALGAGSIRVARAALMDGLVLAGAGGAMGLVVVAAARDLALARFAAEIPSWATFPIDLRVLFAATGGTALAALIVSLVPVLRAIAIGRQAGMAWTATGQSPRSGSRAQNLLLGGQIVLGLVLVTASVGALGTFSRARDFDRLGYRWKGLTAVVVSPERGEGEYGTARVADQLALASEEHAGVRAYALSRPIRLSGPGRPDEPSAIRLPGAVEPLPNAAVPRQSLAVGPGYFDLNAIPIAAGRPITETDGPGAPPAAVISSDAARALWPSRTSESIIGETFEIARDGARAVYVVVGVAAPVILDPTAVEGATVPRIYVSLRQTPDALYGNATPEIQLRVETEELPPTYKEWADWVDAVIPGAAVSQVFTLEDVLRQWVRPILLIGTAFGSLSLLVLVLVSIGIYGTVSYRIASTRREIGIRLALGADVRRVVGPVVGPLARVVLVSVTAGTGLAFATGPILSGGGMPIEATSVGVMALVALLMMVAAAGAAMAPLRRALAIDPSESLRAD
jgi:putative ABC transport system permease protein